MITFRLDRDSPIPLYYQLQRQLRAAIDDGRLPLHGALPTEPDLAEQVGVSRFTVRQAIDQLVREGMLRRERGRGTFVSEPPPPAPKTSSEFAVDLNVAGETQQTRLLRSRVAAPSSEVRAALGLGRRDQVLEIVRLRLLGKTAVTLETLYLPIGVIGDLEAEEICRGNLYELLEQRRGLRVDCAQQILRAVAIDGEATDVLGVKPGSTGFLLERRTYVGTQVVELRRSYFPGDRTSFRVELNGAELIRD